MLRKCFLYLMVLLFCFYIYGCNQFSDSNTSNLPDLSELDIPLFEKVLAEHKGKIVLVNFFASWCPPCKAETPDFVSTYNKFKDKGFVIIGISIDDDLSKAKQFIAEHKITYPTYHAKRELEEKMGVSSIPTNIFYSKDGNLYKAMVGALSMDFLEKTIEELSK